MELTDKVTELKGIGKKKGEILSAYGIDTIEDLVSFFPRKYEDRRQVTPVSRIITGNDALVEAKVISRRYKGSPYSNHAPLSLLTEDDTGMLEVVFFNAKYIQNYFVVGGQYTFFGKVTENMGKKQMIHPDFSRKGDPDDIRGIIPVYPQIKGISQKEIRKYQESLREITASLPEWLPEDIIEEYNLAGAGFSLSNMHFPSDEEYFRMGRYRLVFEELLELQTGLKYIKADMGSTAKGISIDVSQAEEFIDPLPFPLTRGQARAWREISKDLASDVQMNRLLQGDVGSGKTCVAEIAMFSTVKSGYQACMMAPTEILAKQHYQTLRNDFAGYDINIGLLCGSMKRSEKDEVIRRLAAGKIDILVGTHAIIEPGVEFRAIGLVITDEQHRFGVAQRHRLSSKGASPNIMVMTATPIPRTLAVIFYGELDISIIDDMPEGRKKIRTYALAAKDRNRVYDKVLEEVSKGHQAYVVAPLIEDSEKIDARSAEDIFSELMKKFPDKRLGLIHGLLPQEEKDRVMEDFAAGDIDILVATVVIEIGINIPNATVMVIENCERFGLAQMHQLRGRVGRGSEDSYCFLILNKETDVAKQRVEIMASGADGFRIAEEDLKLRGPGEIFGTRQHGLPTMRLSDLYRHGDILEKATKAAEKILDRDPSLTADEDSGLRRRVEKMFGDDIVLQL